MAAAAAEATAEERRLSRWRHNWLRRTKASRGATCFWRRAHRSTEARLTAEARAHLRARRRRRGRSGDARASQAPGSRIGIQASACRVVTPVPCVSLVTWTILVLAGCQLNVFSMKNNVVKIANPDSRLPSLPPTPPTPSTAWVSAAAAVAVAKMDAEVGLYELNPVDP